jgi:hypothetical protein
MIRESVGRRNILVFSSLGGGGHVSAWNALRGALEGEHAIKRIDPFDTLLGPIDPIRRLSGGRLSGEGFYNLCMRRGWFGVASTLASRFGAPAMVRQAGDIERILFPYLDAEAPGFLISVIPFLNAILLHYSRTRGVPFLVLPVDLDARHYIVGFDPDAFDGVRPGGFLVALPFDDPAIRAVIAPAIPDRFVQVLGFPVRADFQEPKNRARLRAALGLPDSAPVVMILMGAAGSTRMVGWAEAAAAAGIPLHLLLCAGRNDRLRRQLEKIRLPDLVTRTVIGYTDRISDLMAASDLLLTKPGPGTIAEAVTLGLPMLLDASGSILAWERLGIDLVRRRGFGEAVPSRAEVGPLVRDWLGDGMRLEQCRASMAALPRYDCLGAVRTMVSKI